MADDGTAENVALVLAGALAAHLVLAGLMTVPGEDYDPVPFTEALIDLAPYIWGAVASLAVVVVFYTVCKAATAYVIYDARADIRGWLDD